LTCCNEKGGLPPFSILKTLAGGFPPVFIYAFNTANCLYSPYVLEFTMSLKIQILDDIKTAMKARETVRLNTLRLLSAALKQKEVDERVELDDAAVLVITEKLIKQRKDSISQFEKAGRQDLVEIETAELAILTTYLPAQMSEAEITAAIDAAIASTGATSGKDMGKVIGVLKPQLAGKADMGKVSGLVKVKLG
jgi:uncharacterized protein YqeY